LRATSSDCSISAMVVMAPMASPPSGVSRMKFSSSICLMSTRYFGDALSCHSMGQALITGGTGFVGRHLASFLKMRTSQLAVLASSGCGDM